MGVLRDGIATAIERWIVARNPPQREIRLGQKQIFIMPNRYGMGLLALLLVLFVMGTNYQNNLVLALCFWLLAVFVLSILLTYYNLAGLGLKAGQGEPGHAGTPVIHHMALFSDRDRYGLLVSGQPVPGDRNMQSVRDSVRWLEALSEHTTERFSLSCVYRQRGQHTAPRVRLDTRFPFGWITAWVFWNPAQSVMVWPAAIDHGVVRRAVALPSGQHVTTAPDRDELDDLRDYQPGDPPRRVLWRHFARRGELHVKTPPQSARGDTQALDLAQVAELPLERGLEQLTYWLLDCEARECSWSLRLGSYWLPSGQGQQQQRAGLAALALYGLRSPVAGQP